MSSARSGAGHITRGSSSWRLYNQGQYTKEITDLFKSMYRSGIVMRRDSRGKNLGLEGPDAAIDRALDKIQALSERMAKDVMVRVQEAQDEYSRMRSVWGKPIRVSSKDMREFRERMHAGDSMLINPRGTRFASDAMERAREGRWQHDFKTNVDLLNDVNRKLNAARNAIWQSATKTGQTDEYVGHFNDELWRRYDKAERAAWRRRRK